MDLGRRRHPARATAIATALVLGAGVSACASSDEPVVTDGTAPDDVVEEPLGEQTPTGDG